MTKGNAEEHSYALQEAYDSGSSFSGYLECSKEFIYLSINRFHCIRRRLLLLESIGRKSLISICHIDQIVSKIDRQNIPDTHH